MRAGTLRHYTLTLAEGHQILVEEHITGTVPGELSKIPEAMRDVIVGAQKLSIRHADLGFRHFPFKKLR